VLTSKFSASGTGWEAVFKLGYKASCIAKTWTDNYIVTKTVHRSCRAPAMASLGRIITKGSPQTELVDTELETLLRAAGEADPWRAADLLAAVSGADVSAPKPPGSLRERILGSTANGGRFARFAAATARLLDLPLAEADQLLDGLDRPESFQPGPVAGAVIYPAKTGSRLPEGTFAGFIRMPAGVAFPKHRHAGGERVLIIRGSCIDPESREVLRAGDEATQAAGSTHSFVVQPGPDLVYLALVVDGIDLPD